MHIKAIDMSRQNMRVCRVCLASEADLFSLREKRLESIFGELTGLLVTGGLVCSVCLQLVRKFQAFRLRSREADAILQQNLPTNKNIDRKHLKYNFEKTEPEFIDINPASRGSKFETTVTLHIDIPPAFDTPLLADDNSVFIKTKLEEDNDPSTLIGEYITKDDIDVVDIKQDNYVEPDFIEPNEENDFTWPDLNNDSDDEYLITKKSTLPKKSKKRKSEVSKKNKIKKEDKKESYKVKKVKLEEATTSVEEVEDKKPDKKPKKVQDEDLVLSTKIAATLRGIWKKNRNKDIYQLFERIYMESLSVKVDDSSCKTASDNITNENQNEDQCTKKKIRNFLELVRKLSDLYNVDTEFVRLDDLRKEMDEKRNSGQYKVADHGCELCCKQYNFLETYKRHMNRNHNNDWQIECDICRYRFKTQRDFLSHIMMHARNIKCRECGVLISSKWCNAKKHAECHRGVVHACTLCNQTFTRKKSLSMHLRARHRSEMEAVMCLLCGDTYNGGEGLKIHIRCMHKQATQCRSCAVWFLDADTLAAHTSADAGGCQPQHSSCPMCGVNFSSEETMLEHHKELHPMYKCVQCKTTFESGKTCVHFKYNHNLVKGKTKTQKKRTRFYNKDIICEICGKNNFTCVATLKIHQRIHTGERPFQCDICQKTFRMRSDLKLHTAIHTGERSYKCPYCPRTFRQPPHLKSHLPTHTKEKAHVCEICHKRFTQRANMQEHVRTIHEGLPPKRRQRHSKIFEA